MARHEDARAVPVELDRPRRLRYTFNSLCILQDRLGLRADELLTESKLGFKQVRAFLWSGLIEEDPSLTPEAVGEMVQDYLERGAKLPELMASMLEALRRSGLIGQQAPAGEAPTGPFDSPTSSTEPSSPPESTAG